MVVRLTDTTKPTKPTGSFSGGGGFGGSFGSSNGTQATGPLGGGGSNFSGGGGFGGGFGGTPVKPTAPVAPPNDALKIPTGGNSNSSGVGVTSTGQVAQFAAPMSQDDWWNQDANYQAENAGYNNTLQSALAALAASRAQYDTDFVQTLKNLGWNWGGANNNDLSSVAQGSWDPNNMLGAYGQGLNNLNNDYAGRGLLTSSFYNNALGNFGTDFNNQFSNLQTQRQNNVNDQTSQEQSARNEYQNALTRAKQSSLARAAAQGLQLQ